MKYLLSIVLLLNCLYGFSQNHSDALEGYLNNYQYQTALQLIEELPISKDLELKKAFCYKRLDNYGKAIDVLLPLSKEYAEDKSIKLELASCYQSLGNWKSGIDCYASLLEADTSNVYYKIQIADLQFRMADYNEALLSYKDLENTYQMQNMIKRSAQCFERMNMPDSAIVHYQRAWSVDSTDVYSVSSLVNMNIKLGKEHIRAAIDHSELYIKRDSTNKQINLLNALSYYADNNYEMAADRFEKCYQQGDSSLLVNRSLGISYYSLGMNTMSHPFLLKAYEQDSTNNNVLYCLAVVNNEMKDYDNAIGDFSTLLDRVIPGDLTLYLYYRGLGKAYEGHKSDQLAVDNLILAEKYASENQKITLYYDIAVLYDYELRDAHKAHAYYLKYRESLQNYLIQQKKKMSSDADDRSIREIKNLESKIESLNSHITRLEKEIAQDKN